MPSVPFFRSLFRFGSSLALVLAMSLLPAGAQEVGPVPAPTPSQVTTETAIVPASSAVEAVPPGVEIVGAVEEGGPNTLPASVLPHNLSPWGMFMTADYVVKAVMIGLALASLATWIVWLAKSLELFGAKRRARGALKIVTGSLTLGDAIVALGTRRGVGALLVNAAEEEVNLSLAALDYVDGSGLKERITSRLSRLVAAAGRRVSRGTGILATVGSVSPFVGLFGTVWGIMNAFIGISEAQTTNLAIVAPGIAEALLATAIGLVAAIPAVVIYNIFVRSIAGYRQLLTDIGEGVERLVSRDLDYRAVPAQRRSDTDIARVGAEMA